jgi:HK97 family phage major capsid protein
VVDNIRQNISVGYRIDGRVENEDDPEEYYRVRTTPMEISIVSIPADQSNLVGVGRSNPETLVTVQTEGESEMSDINLEEVRAAAAEEAAKAARRDAKDIMVLARKHNKADLGEEAIGKGVNIDEFRGQLLDVIGDEPLDTPAHVVDAPVKEQREYSLGKMIRAQVIGDWSDAGFEREIHEEIAQRVGKQAEGFYVPDFAFRAGPMSTAATGGSGSENVTDNFVPTIHRGDMFIEALRAKQVMSNLGVTFMGGLTNRIKMPKIATGAAAAFVEELADVADQSPTDGSVDLQPRTLGAYADISRLLMKESVPAIDQVVQDDLLRSVADKIEYYAIQGSGSSGQPTGILNAAGVGNVDISAGTDVAALTWADITDLVKTVEDADGVINQATLGWLSNPKVKAKLANTAKVGSTDSVMLMNDPWTSMYGYPAEFTSNVPSDLDPGDGGSDASALIFGDFSQLIVGLFGAPSILVDETTGGLAGTVRIIVHQDVDVAVRHGASFAKTDEVSVA